MNYNRDYVSLDSQNNYLSNSSYNFNNIKKQAYTILYLFVLILISASILFYISQVININQQRSKLMELEKDLQKIKAKNEQLELKLASKTSLAEVEKIAKNELNMIEAKKKETLVYNDKVTPQKYVADIPKEKFFLVQVYDKIVKEVTTVQAESLD